ncbi:MAG: hypothetical protein JNM69_29830 [Archangium sp.]|nr:hypothetical protein [Archangium sp.]
MGNSRIHWFSVVPLVVGLAGFSVFYGAVAPHDPPKNWLVWRYLLVLLQAGLFAVGSWCGGFFLTRRLGLGSTPFRERLVYAFALGVLGWALLTVAVGLMHGLSTPAFVLLPLVGLVAGGRQMWRALRRFRRLSLRLRASRPRLVDGVLRTFGLACLGLIWVPLLTPRNILYDAHWYHLPLAEQYAAAHAIFRLDEGWFAGTMPHLASYLYTWAFLSPVAQPFDSIVLASHLEFVLFVATVFALPVVLDVLVPRPRWRVGWVAFFLFPGVFLYDSALGAAADHALAFWAAPLFLSLWRLWRRPTLRMGALFGAMAGAAALTKYHALMLLAGPAIAIAARLVWSLVRRRFDFVKAAALALGFALLVSTPHWLLNSLWYHNPIYPHAGSLFPSTPMVQGIDASIVDKAWVPKGTTREKLVAVAKATLRFGFEAHDWDTFHGNRPTFGSLFLISVALLPFAARRRRVLALVGATWLGVPIWYWTQHQDRYLQALVPWAAAVVGAVLVGVWRKHVLARPVVAALAGFQLLHAGDLWSLPAHSVMKVAPIHQVIDLIASSRPEAPDELIENHFAISRARKVLPPDARVLIHDLHLHLGLGRRAVRDHVTRQGAINWALLGSTRNAAALMEQLGVTHLYWLGTPVGFSAIGDDLVFYRFAQLTGAAATSLGDGSFITPIDKARVQSETPTVLVMVCATERMTPLELNRRWEPLYFTPCEAPVVPDDLDAQLASSEVVVVDSRKHPQVHPRLAAEFMLLFDRYGFKVWGRR